MFESLTEKLQVVFRRLRQKGVLTDQDVADALREVRLALLEADVNLKVAKDFIARVRERAIGGEILEGLNAPQQVIKIVSEELTSLLGGDQSPLRFASRPPTVIMLCGLQGAGKTTHAGKLATLLRKQGRNPLLVAADIYRPAAIKQLQVVGEHAKTPVFSLGDGVDPVEIARQSIVSAYAGGHDVVIIDTAGRLQIDEPLMEELRRIKRAVTPQETLLVVDGMTGQESVNVAQSFNTALDIDGFIMTKLDGDTRGGAALSIKSITGKPIKFIGLGEKLDTLEVFHPDRMASRILGMGDVMTFIEKAEAALDEKQAREVEQKLRLNTFGLDDYLEQMRQMRKMGSLQQILSMVPGMGGLANHDLGDTEKSQRRVEAIICSMTPQERREPGIINGSRRRRIAAGSGTTVQEVNQLLSNFEQTRRMVRGMATGDFGAGPGMAATGRHAGSNKKSKRKQGTFKFPFGRG
ncbi:MAG: signal recognition particle protein [Capsulimonadaceae bacterium]